MTSAELKQLEAKVQDISDTVRGHMKIIVQSLKEQEKVIGDNTKLLERSYHEQQAQKMSYADMVRGSCDKVVKEVGAKIDNIPPHETQGTKDSAETTRAISRVFDSFVDRENRKLNVVVHNLPEQEGESVAEKTENDIKLFKEVIKEGMSLIVRPTKAFRAGRKVEGKPRLLIVSLENVDTKVELLKMAPQLRHLTTWKRIYVTPDLPKKERDEGKRLREELSNRRQAGEENLAIRRGKIVKLSQTSQDETDTTRHFVNAAGPAVVTSLSRTSQDSHPDSEQRPAATPSVGQTTTASTEKEGQSHATQEPSEI